MRSKILKYFNWYIDGRVIPSFHQIQNGLLNQFEKRCKVTKLYSKPVHITIETTNRCIFKCEICPRNADKVRKEGNMSLDTFNNIEPLLQNALYVNLSGFGETLLNPKFFRMLRTIKNYNCYTMIYTNGYLMTPKVCKEILNNGLDEIDISIDGSSAEIYESIRKNGNFCRLINNIDQLDKMKKIRSTKYPILKINFMATEKNVRELPDIVRLASTYDFSHINVLNFAVYSKEYERYSLFNHMDLADEYIKRAEKIAKILGVGLSIPCFEFKNIRCDDVFSKIYVTWDGKVTTCANQSYIMGDINQTNITDIWNNSQYQKLRKLFIENKLPDQCANCYMHIISKKTFIDYPQKLIKDRLEGRIRYDLD